MAVHGDVPEEGTRHNKEITIKDVAKQSGVSITTVSRVLSGSDYPVRSAVREKVLLTAKELHYVPTRAKRTVDEIAVLIPSVSNPFYASLVAGFEEAVVHEGHQLSIFTTSHISTAGPQLIQSVLQKNIRALFIASANIYPAAEKLEKELRNRKVRVVFADCPSPDSRFSSVSFDYEKGSFMGMEFLIEMGHREIVYAGLELERESRVLRVRGFERALRQYGLPYTEDSLVLLQGSNVSENSQTQSGEELAKKILALPRRPSAVVAINDMVAFGMMRYFRQQGVRMPEDISIIGFDDSIFCDLSHPTLTTVKVQPEQMGRMAGMLLLNDLQGLGKEPVNLSLEPTVVRRDSVMALRK